MTRKLLPYEHQLIDALGITKKEYLDFVAAAPIYEDPKQGTVLDIRNDPGTVGLILTIVGILFQVAAALLAPRPSVPETKGAAQTRDERYAPKFGFNGAQELANYGDPVSLVYTSISDNDKGGVRVSTALLWSEVLSFGGNQFMRLMLAVGAGPIGAIGVMRTAIGQLPLRDYPQSNVWLYWNPSGNTHYYHLVNGNTYADPSVTGSTTARINTLDAARDKFGFSQAYAPSTSASCGVTAVIPINVEVLQIDASGDRKRRWVGTDLNNEAAYWPPAGSSRSTVPVGAVFTLTIPQTGTVEDTGNARRSEASAIFSGARFKCGSVILRVTDISGADVDVSPITVTLECERQGIFSLVSYDVRHWLSAVGYDKDAFYLKCLAHIEEAHYASTTACQALDVALKVRAYRRLSGRAEVYGSAQISYGDSTSDNGIQPRTVMFRLYWRFAGSSAYRLAPQIFCVRGISEQDIYTYLTLVHADGSFTTPNTPRNWEIKLEPVLEPRAEPGVTHYCYLNSNSPSQRMNAGDSSGDSQVFVLFSGDIYTYGNRLPIGDTVSDIYEWDLYNYDSNSNSQFSYEQGPEVTITAVSEQLLKPWSEYSDSLYSGISTLGLHVFASKATENLRNVTVWVTQGKQLRRLSTDPALYDTDAEVAALVASVPNGSSSYASDIFLDTVLDSVNGIGQYASIHSVDVRQLAITKKFCVYNRLFMDGVVADPQSWREFWAQTAPYSLLELAKIGGRDTLIPGVPYNQSTGAIDPVLPINALFTAGNVLEDSYKEEFIDYGASVQDTVVTVVYRDTEFNNVFPSQSSVEVHLQEIDTTNALLETVDASQFVTRREQAVLLGKFLCLSKRYIRRAIEFKTFPTDSPVFPGAYVYVEIGLNQWDNIYSGRIEDGGFLNAPLPTQVPNGTYTVFVYTSGSTTAQFSSVTVTNNVASALQSYAGSLFVLGQSIRNKRVFRVTEVGMDEEGEVTIKAVEHPTDTSGQSLIAQRLINSGQFFVDGILS